MPTTCVIGAQRGDEGKARIVDLLADEADVIVRYQGGSNAGHTVMRDAVEFLHDAVAAGRTVLFEGAQAVLLDVDVGIYPYVTASNSSALGVTAGTGLPPRAIDRVIGCAKAYATHVGSGPFPTEDGGPDGARLRDVGREYGTTTGRPVAAAGSTRSPSGSRSGATGSMPSRS